MNLSLRNRIAISFVVANLVVLILSFTVFHFLNSLNREIETITAKTNRVALLTDEIRISAVSILKYQRRILTDKSGGKDVAELVDKILNLCESFTSQLQTLDSLYRDPDVQKVVAQMLSYVDSLRLVLSKASLFQRDNVGMASIGELADKILESFSEFQDIQYFQSVERDKKIKKVINETKRNMMITLIIGFLGTIILGLVVPGKIALPFKKIKDAVRELQNCNFDVSIYYQQNDEIGELASEINKMIGSFKSFDELRTDRISVEHRKFDALANTIKRPVLVANAEGVVMYLNAYLYSLLQVRTEDIVGKKMDETVLSSSIIESYELAIKRRSKIENSEVNIIAPTEKGGHELDESKGKVVFKGYANVIPIRGKESSLDYYIMVMSTDMFV